MASREWTDEQIAELVDDVKEQMITAAKVCYSSDRFVPFPGIEQFEDALRSYRVDVKLGQGVIL